MWKMIDAVSRSPAIQCHCTHANFTPTIGKKAVSTSTSMLDAMIQWKIRATPLWRGIRGGRPLQLCFQAIDFARIALVMLREQHVAAVGQEEQHPADQ